MPDVDAQLARGSLEVVDIRRLVDRGGLRFVVSLLIDYADDQWRVDGVVVRAGSRGERDVWVETTNHAANTPFMLRVPPDLADVIVQLVLARAEGAMIGTPVGASECAI